ncbi:copper chaperone PCu(A)C [Streptomyces sp. 891-h]|uniref:copper chaperone PCu(A)C n=1 Tax=unclassified Streptomyces TaxID=2593676 RepID=UPI001FAA73EB|nr:copper chaperone PCu(A)C [Streptomyces sp. 891-h]UNZ16590.1 copper chaperone PCu(A)C [Streptomyces sp. 891-h]
MAHLCELRRRAGWAAAALILVASASGCGGDEDFDLPDWDAPGQNSRVGDLMLRYAHLAEPRGGEPWKPGDDVPGYVWVYNKSQKDDKLIGASSPVASSVQIVGADDKPREEVRLPAQKLVELESGKPHLLLRGLRKQIRGGEYVKITLRFRDAGSTTFNIAAQRPQRDESPSPSE